MTDLSSYSTHELLQELEKRKFNQERPGLLPSPVILTDLQDLCEEYLDFVMENYHDDIAGKFETAIFEKTMETLYIGNPFIWINKQIELHETT